MKIMLHRIPQINTLKNSVSKAIFTVILSMAALIETFSYYFQHLIQAILK